MKSRKSCINCIRGYVISINNDIVCRDMGIVSPDFYCKKYRAVPDNLKQENKCINCENFSLEIITHSGISSMGLCQLFSVRKFDGNKKNACSKFVKRKNAEVS